MKMMQTDAAQTALYESLDQLEQINLEFLRLLREKKKQAYLPLIDQRIALSDRISQLYQTQQSKLNELPAHLIDKVKHVLSLDNELLVYLDLEARKLQNRNARRNWELGRQSTI